MENQHDLALEGEFPWMVALMDENDQYFGGGSLIAPDVVLTSSYVTKDKEIEQIFVRAGEWNFKNTSEPQPHVKVGIRSKVRHPGFRIASGANNAALLFLESPLELTRHIQPICMPAASRNFDSSRCIVSGWGKKLNSDVRYMDVLKKIEVPLVKNPVCQTIMQLLNEDDFLLDESLMCAGGELTKDSCIARWWLSACLSPEGRSRAV
ncbi:hypothetical protein M5D96_008313 [Drosophila gunungcola]|uniref:Peptidase S1 domain-containing protein n=1 Tax=Drosophila gunungcola TaxID=103775 RepID=A0A9P9YKK3_9MUSC|nr:hypothetical protein M5D96_008313 [Drosophila gunungcola]